MRKFKLLQVADDVVVAPCAALCRGKNAANHMYGVSFNYDKVGVRWQGRQGLPAIGELVVVQLRNTASATMPRLAAAAQHAHAARIDCCDSGTSRGSTLYDLRCDCLQVCGCIEPEERDPLRYNNTYLDRFRRAAPRLMKHNTIDVEGVKQLLAMSGGIQGFTGGSAYVFVALLSLNEPVAISID